MKKGKVLLLGCIVSILSIIILLLIYFRKTSLNNLVNWDEIDYIYFIDGNSGDITEVHETDTIKKVKVFFGSITCRKTIKIMPSGGYSYYFTLVDKNGNEDKVMFIDDTIDVNGKRYYVVRQSEEIESFVENLTCK